MITPAHVVIERFSHVTPFGLGLWDVVTNRLVTDGLRVRVHAMSGARITSSIDATPTRGGLFAAHRLAGLRAFEAGEVEGWEMASPLHPWLVEVRDDLGQYTPFALHVVLPVSGIVRAACVDALWPVAPPPPPAHGPLAVSSPPSTATSPASPPRGGGRGGATSPPTSPLASPPSSPPRVPPNAPLSPPAAIPPSYVPLFSLPSRTVPAGRAAVRATLLDRATGEPAARAVLEVRHAGVLMARGIADARGQVLAAFAYPEPPMSWPGSPPGPPIPQVPLTSQTWPVTIAVRHRRAHTTYPAGAANALPDLCELLGQPLAAVQTASPLAPLTGATLRYGEELVLGAESGAELILSPA